MNHLQFESSPYLLQHAQNPVDWYAWKPAALQRALAEDKPILVSIGYSTCHWCHVMEKESFEDPDVAAYMNRHFVNIKIDREERPDLDQIYMEACQAITGSGGWPLNCFLLPDGTPFLAGTYYPAEPKYNRPSWIQLLRQVVKVFREERAKVEDQANRLSALIGRSNQVFLNDQLEMPQGKATFADSMPRQLYEQLTATFDLQNGGFGGAPKFPSTMSLAFLLKYGALYENKEALDHVHLSLEKMIRGGIYDQLGGGFARYATDKEWLIPHFEKMLYDNALLLSLLAEAYRHSKKEMYKTTLLEMLQFIQTELMHPSGGFYAALDADSEGEEGKFYTWTYEEINAVLGAEALLFCAFYGITKEGNWEGKNILWQAHEIAAFADRHNVSLDDFSAQLKRNRTQLLQARSRRIRPGLDHKIILSWNALMISAMVKAYHASGLEDFAALARKNMRFLQANFQSGDGSAYLHVATVDGDKVNVQYPAFLNDYAFLIEAFLDFYSLDFETQWIRKAADLSEFVWEAFAEDDTNLLYFTRKGQQDIPIRKVAILDNAIPSGNASLANSWISLAVLTGEEEYRNRAERMLLKVEKGLRKYPGSFAKWASALLSLVNPIKEVAIIGDNARSKARILQSLDINNLVMMVSEREEDQFPLLANKPTKKDAQIFICQNFTCDRPVLEVETAHQRLKN